MMYKLIAHLYKYVPDKNNTLRKISEYNKCSKIIT